MPANRDQFHKRNKSDRERVKDLNSGIERARYISKLNKHLGIDYQKNCNNMHLHLSPTKRDVAIKNAERLLQEYDPNSSPSQNDPSTTVHELVKILVEASKSLR